MAFFTGLVAAGGWQDVLKFLSAAPFGQTDPLFGKDIAFYVFSLPVYSLGLGLIKALILLSLAGCGAVYILRGSLSLPTRLGKFKPNRQAGLHIGILLALFLAALAAGARLSLYNLLITQTGPVFGAAFTDATAMVPILKFSVFTYGLAAFLALFFGLSGKILPLLGAASVTVLLGPASAVIPGAFQKLVVAPNELVKETPFIKYNIESTRLAYGLNKIEEREIAADKPITASDIAANNLTIKNVRLWDRAPLLSTFSQIQEIRTYYEFAAADNDRYTIDGEIRQIMLSPPELAITRPEIYYGEILNDYVIVNTKSKEFDYPKGEENVYAPYAGSGGITINSPLRRLLFALRFKDLKLLLSDEITAQSRIQYFRNVPERVARNDGGRYGKLIVYRFPKDKLIFGPKQVIARINQDAEVGRQITLWDQRGSQVIQGPLLVIPVEESLIYVRPLYLKADSGKIPELKRVIVAYEKGRWWIFTLKS